MERPDYEINKLIFLNLLSFFIILLLEEGSLKEVIWLFYQRFQIIF